MPQQLNLKFNLFVMTTIIMSIWSYLIATVTLFNFWPLFINMYFLGFIIGLGYCYHNYQQKKYSSKTDLSISFIANSFLFTAFLCAALLLSNFYFSTKQGIEEHQYPITEGYFYQKNKTAHSRGSRVPVFVIDYKGTEQAIEFSKYYATHAAQYRTVELSSRKGIWGWDVIVDKKALQ